MSQYEQFETFSFKPWMGIVAGLLIFALARSLQTDEGVVLRGVGMTCFFGSSFVAHRRRKERGGGASVGKLKAIVFARFTALLTLAFIIAYIYDHWLR